MLKNRLFCYIALAFGLASCGMEAKQEFPKSTEEQRDEKAGKLGGGLFKWGFGEKKRSGYSDVAVNAYLWQASLDVVYTMPMQLLDPRAGVIMTDWNQGPINEDIGDASVSYKVNIYITSDVLSPDSIKVAVFSDMGGGGAMPSDLELARRLEDRILRKARDMKIMHLD